MATETEIKGLHWGWVISGIAILAGIVFLILWYNKNKVATTVAQTVATQTPVQQPTTNASGAPVIVANPMPVAAPIVIVPVVAPAPAAMPVITTPVVEPVIDIVVPPVTPPVPPPPPPVVVPLVGNYNVLTLDADGKYYAHNLPAPYGSMPVYFPTGGSVAGGVLVPAPVPVTNTMGGVLQNWLVYSTTYNRIYLLQAQPTTSYSYEKGYANSIPNKFIIDNSGNIAAGTF